MSDRGGAHAPVIELTLARIREFLREPEAVFWVFVFPILMACALGVAFRSRGDQAIVVGILNAPGHQAIEQALRRTGGFESRLVESSQVQAALQRADVQLVIEPGETPTYRLDPTRDFCSEVPLVHGQSECLGHRDPEQVAVMEDLPGIGCVNVPVDLEGHRRTTYIIFIQVEGSRVVHDRVHSGNLRLAIDSNNRNPERQVRNPLRRRR